MALNFPANPVVGQPSGTYEYTAPDGTTVIYTWDGEKWTAKVDGGASGEVPSGESGDRPGAPTPGDLFYDTTLGSLLYWDGSQWVAVGQVTKIVAGEGITVTPGSGIGEVTITADAPVNPPGDTEPGAPEHGDLWVDTSVCPPVLRIYVDEAECPGEGGWNEIEGGGDGSKPIDPTPDDGNHTITPSVTGSGTQADPYVFAPEEVNFGGSTGSNEVITFTGQPVGSLVQFSDLNSGTNGARFTQPVGVIDANGSFSTNLKFSDSPNSSIETAYDGLIKVGQIYIKWEVTATPVPVDPPEITQTPVISSDNNYTDEPITVDTRAAVTNASFTSSIWLKDGAEITGATSTSSYTPTEAGTYKFREVFTGADNSTVDVDSNELAITVQPDGPSATMSGLRFDSARQTHLSKSFTKSAQTWSWSGWVKKTSQGASSAFFAVYKGDNNRYGYFRFESDGSVSFYAGVYDATNAAFSFTTAGKYNDLNWLHVVVNYDSTQALESERFKAYINGTAVNNWTSTNYPGQNVESYFNTDYPHYVGTERGTNQSQTFDGYMSDVYFVDGKALTPDVFGESFDNKWGPLDPADVKTNIAAAGGFGANGFHLPFDPANDGENYSSRIATKTGDVARAEALFNGDLTVGFGNSDNTNNNLATITFDPVITATEKIRVYATGNNNCPVTINGSQLINQLTQPGGGSLTWYDVEGLTLSSLSVQQASGQGNAQVFAIEVDGVVLNDHSSIGVDASGNENNFHDQNFGTDTSGTLWSANITGDPGRPTNMFDGSIESESTFKVGNFGVTLAGFNSVKRVRVYAGGGAANGILINNANRQSVQPGPQWLEWYLNNTSLTSVSVDFVTGDAVGVYAIEVDGQILSDPSALDMVFDTPIKNYAVLESGSNGNLVGDVSAIQNSLTTIPIPTSGKVYFEATVMRQTAGWVVGLGINNAVPANDSVIAVSEGGLLYKGDGNPPGSTLPAFNVGDVLGVLVDVDADEVQFSHNGSINATTIILSNLNNPYPYTHINNSGVAVNFGQQPFVYTQLGYEGVYQNWSEYARTELGYALDRIAVLEGDNAALRGQIELALSRIASLEADEINDDATDTVLVNAVADLITRVEALEA